jgi:predicted permease
MTAVLSAIVPVFLVASVGAALRRAMFLDVKTLSTLNVYLFMPALVFSSLSKQVIEWSLFGRFAAATAAAFALLLLILAALSGYRGHQGAARSAFLLTAFPNLGNFGLPVARFAFGEVGLTLAVIVMVCGSLVQNTLGLYLAQRGSQSARAAFISVFRFPIIYAFALALLSQRTGWRLPEAFGNAVDLAGEAAIPVQLLVLGIKLGETRLETGADVLLASLVRLGVGPLVGLAVAGFLGLEALERAIFVLQMSGPVAVGMAAFGVQFDCQPRFLASVVSWTFLLSLFSVSFLLYLFLSA